MPAVKTIAISCQSLACLDKILARRIIIVHILAAALAIPCAPLTKPLRNHFSMLFWDFKALCRARISLRSLARTMMDFFRVDVFWVEFVLARILYLAFEILKEVILMKYVGAIF